MPVFELIKKIDDLNARYETAIDLGKLQKALELKNQYGVIEEKLRLILNLRRGGQVA